MKLITVATYVYGLYNDLINNSYGAKIITLGFGKKWTGFKMKYIEVYKYIQNLDDDEIIVFIDGFDSKINKNPQLALNLFKQMKCGILFSEDSNVNEKKKYIFGECRGTIINSGLYMGYVKYLKILLPKMINMKCQDDQRNINQACHNHNFIKIDTKKLIFENLKPKTKPSNAIFVSFPGSPSIQRGLRLPKEYGQFWIKELFLMYLLGTFIAIWKKKYKIVIGLFLFFSFYLLYIDKSCKKITDHINEVIQVIQN
jgi:hypothetical protein